MKLVIQSAKESLTHRREVLRRSSERTGGDHIELQAIERALDKISNERYGLCELCGGAIGGQRLKALPEETRCADCHLTSSPLQIH